AARNGTVDKGLGEINVAQPVSSALGGFAVLCRPFPAEVPFANGRGQVAVLFEKGGHGQTAWFNECLAPRRENIGFQPRSPAIAARQDGVARRGADRGGRVSVSETHSFGGQAIEIWRGNLGVLVITAEVAVPQVVGQDI